MILRKISMDGGKRWAVDDKLLPAGWSLGDLLSSDPPNPGDWLLDLALEDPPRSSTLLAPVDNCQELWASGVTYLRSRDARRQESHDADFYDRVYDAVRPELFLKAIGWRVVGPQAPVGVRRDSTWNVPEPELVLVLSASMRVLGFTVGNDVSSRSIEGENPLYLPQAKMFDGASALGPGILLAETFQDGAAFDIQMRVLRDGTERFTGAVSTSDMKRTFDELAGWLGRNLQFPRGVLLMTGTGLVPDDTFSLVPGDVVEITIDGIGTLRNPVVEV